MDPSQKLRLLQPLRYFYDKEERGMPLFHFVDRDEIPQPERDLLVHDSDMTSRLREYHESQVELDILRAERMGDDYTRLVILRSEETDEPVEFGAILLHLDQMEPLMVDEVVEGDEPFGQILDRFHTTFFSSPRAFFVTTVDEILSDCLEASQGDQVYGRCNAIADKDGNLLAEIVEILPSGGGGAATELMG
ncbi:MAG: hypothetical protein AAF555_06225 [Verrucomicrobiota bacterium]